MPKAKILAVAPYEGMADLIMETARKRDDVVLTVQTGDLYTGKEIALQLAHKNYDVILSRGGTAELIRSSVELPVIDISISVYDVLRSIKLAENYAGKFVIAGFGGITGCAHLLCDLLQYDIDIITFESEADAKPMLLHAKQTGCSLALCDMAGANAAKEIGLNSLLISSGAESIENALNEAVKLVQSSRHVHLQKDLFQSLLTGDDREFLIYSPAGTLWFTSIAIDEMNISVMNLVETYLKAFFKVPNQTIARQIRDEVYILCNQHLLYEDQRYVAVTIKKQKAILKEGDPGIIISNGPSHSTNDFLNFYGNSAKTGNIAHIIQEYSRSHLPVLIAGEVGTGKDKAAALLYENGPYSNAPLVTINCSLMSERKWNHLLESENSPLNAAHTTIYLKNPSALSAEQLNNLLLYLDQTNLCKRNRLIVSCIIERETKGSADAIRTVLENRYHALTLTLPPLRERLDEFPSMIALYIHRQNIALGKQIIALDAEAMEEMTAYQWPHNLDQLQHVLRELITISTTPYISLADVRNMLKQEPSSFADSNSAFLFTGTLEEMNVRMIKQVLEQEKGNKEKTAKRLGISRSTLWRILKNNRE